MATQSSNLHTSVSSDQLSIGTPELVAIEFPIAGIGSRFIAILLDYLLQAIAIVVCVLVFALVFSGSIGNQLGHAAEHLSTKWTVAIAIAVPFVLEWGYFALFEAFWRGQTPGKRIMHIRVIQQTGRPISLFESLGRNLLRFIDMLPTAYIVGIVSMFVTRRQQRLGDLVAGTLVVHERELEAPLEKVGVNRTITTAVFREPAPVPPRESKLPADAVAVLTLADLHAVEGYLARRLDVPIETRARLCARLAENISAKMNFPLPADMSQETFLEEVATALRSMHHLAR